MDDILIYNWPERGIFTLNGALLGSDVRRTAAFLRRWRGKVMISYGALCNMKSEATTISGAELASMLENVCRGGSEPNLSPLLSITLYQGLDGKVWCNWPTIKVPAA